MAKIEIFTHELKFWSKIVVKHLDGIFKLSFQYIINDLEEVDKFNIVYFDHNSDKLFEESVSTATGSEEALRFVRSLTDGGSTDTEFENLISKKLVNFRR